MSSATTSNPADCDDWTWVLPPGLFTFSRSEGYPTRYADQFNPAHVDVLTAGLILAFCLLAFCLYLTLPAYKSTRRWNLFIHVTLSLFIGAGIVVGNFGHEWEVGSVRIVSPYKPGTADELEADLGLHIALRGVNITLRNPGNLTLLEDLSKETIDYNEHFSWEWAQGRFGFGKYAGHISRDFRAAVLRGTPFPILQVAEYFTFDGEGLRFGRHYRLAGWYAHIMMWTAFPLWIITNILFCMVVYDGAVLLMLTGFCQLIANAIWYYLRNPIELNIPFEAPSSSPHGIPPPEVILKTQFGNDYYLVLFNGFLCVFLGLFIVILNARIPDTICKFFNIDPLSAFDELILSSEELQKVQGQDQDQLKNFKLQSGGGLRMEGGKVKITVGDHSADTTSAGEDKDEESDPRDSSSSQDSTTVLRRRETAGAKFTRHVQNSFRIKPNVKPRKQIDDQVHFRKSVPKPQDTLEEENESESGEPTVFTPSLQSVPEVRVPIEEEEEEDDSPTYDNLPPLKSEVVRRREHQP